jgi:hypothetical protein
MKTPSKNDTARTPTATPQRRPPPKKNRIFHETPTVVVQILPSDDAGQFTDCATVILEVTYVGGILAPVSSTVKVRLGIEDTLSHDTRVVPPSSAPLSLHPGDSVILVAQFGTSDLGGPAEERRYVVTESPLQPLPKGINLVLPPPTYGVCPG